MRRWFEIILNIFFWIITAWMILSGFSIVNRQVEVINGIETVSVTRNEDILRLLATAIILASVLFYMNLWNIGLIGKGKNKIRVPARSIILFILFTGLYIWLSYMELFPGQAELPSSLVGGIFIFYFTVSWAYGLGKVWVNSESQTRSLELEKKQTELNMLRSNLQPHFLFNVLNNFLSMVDQEKNPALAGYIEKLSGLLRYVIYETSEKKVPVRKEIEFIRNYAELQMIRYEKDEINFTLKISGEFDSQPVEPGIYIPFIENAFKHGVEPGNKSSITVEFNLAEPRKILFVVSNSVISTIVNTNISGSGIISTQDRLKLVYPDRHRLIISNHEGFHVQLEIITDESDYR